jgi:hypothetical protein
MSRSASFVPPDLTGILDKAQKENDWSDAETQEARTWYERFLELNWANPDNGIEVINAKADLLWHAHITHTVRYRNYCTEILGYFLDHIPMEAPRAPTLAEKDAAAQAYGKGGVIPDSIIWCTPKPKKKPEDD